MNLRVAFVGFTDFDTEELELTIAGATLDDLLAALETAEVERLRAVCHHGHVIDSGVMLLCNERRLDERRLDQRLADGDRLQFVRLVAGG